MKSNTSVQVCVDIQYGTLTHTIHGRMVYSAEYRWMQGRKYHKAGSINVIHIIKNFSQCDKSVSDIVMCC